MKIVLQKIFFTLIYSSISFFTFSQAGTFDSSFGINGVVTNNTNDWISAAIQPDGKIVVAGTEGQIILGEANIIITRYNSNGTRDSSFGINGFVRTYFDSGGATGCVSSHILIQDDGKILLGGWEYHNLVGGDFFILVRYLTTGDYDSSFGINGKESDFIGPYPKENILSSVTIKKDGKILAAGYSDGLCLVSYTKKGKIDTSFAANGILRINDTESFGLGEIAIQSDKKIVAASNGGNFDDILPDDYIITRILPIGQFDSTFGTNGFVYTDFGNSIDRLGSLALLQNGGFIAAGTTYQGPTTEIALAKYKSNGSLDSSFGINGKIVSLFGETSISATNILLQPDGKMIVMGSMLLRLNEDGSLDSSFGVDGKAIRFATSSSNGILQDDNKIFVVNRDLFRFKGDDPLSVSIQKNISVPEGNSGTITPAVFKVVLNRSFSKNVLVNYSTKDLNAKAGSDYIGTSGTVKIKHGTLSANIIVKVIGDYEGEPDERFGIVLSNPTNAILGINDSAICTIKNDDPLFTDYTPGNKNLPNGNKIRVYPNPATNIITIEGLNTNAKTKISFLNSEGKTISENIITAEIFTKNLHQLSAGLYILKIESGNNTEILKFVKE